MEATSFFETLVTIYKTTQHEIPVIIDLYATVLSSQELVILMERPNKFKISA
jgi:hypothetical protein